MSFREEMVSADPGPEEVPSPEAEAEAGGEGGKGGEEHPVIAGLEAKAEGPDEAQPLDHPQGLVGEKPAAGSIEKRG